MDDAVVLRSGEDLSRQSITCPSGEYTLTHQPNGDVVIYRTWDGGAVWSTGTARPSAPGSAPGRLALQDGDLLVLDATGTPLWSSGTAGRPLVQAILRDNGMLALLEADGRLDWRTPSAPPPPTWDGWRRVARGHALRPGETLRHGSLTSPSGAYVLTVDQTGTPRLWQRDGGLIWELGSDQPGYGLAMTDEGLLSRRRPDGRLPMHPDEQLRGRGDEGWLYGEELRVTDAGTLELVSAAGRRVWTSGPEPVKPSYPSQVRPQGAPDPDARLDTERTPLIRTDFTDDAAWADVLRRIVETPSMTGPGELDPIDDRSFDGMTVEQLLSILPADSEHALAFIADSATFASRERHLMAVQLDAEESEAGRLLRVVPEAVSMIAITLAVGRNDWDDYEQAVDTDGVLRETYE